MAISEEKKLYNKVRSRLHRERRDQYRAEMKRITARVVDPVLAEEEKAVGAYEAALSSREAARNEIRDQIRELEMKLLQVEKDFAPEVASLWVKRDQAQQAWSDANKAAQEEGLKAYPDMREGEIMASTWGSTPYAQAAIEAEIKRLTEKKDACND